MGSQRQDGWAVSYIIIGIVLLVALVGGIVYLRNLQQSQTESQMTPATTEESTETTTEPGGEEGAESNDEVASDRSQNDATDTNSSATDAGTAANTEDEALPATGPNEDVLYAMFVISLITFSLTAYTQSSRQASSL